jgi:hypothetical protein
LIIFIINVLNPFDRKSTLSMTHIRMTIGCFVLSLSGLLSGPANAASSGLQFVDLPSVFAQQHPTLVPVSLPPYGASDSQDEMLDEEEELEVSGDGGSSSSRCCRSR